MEKESLYNFFEKHIKDTAEKAAVEDRKFLLCKLTLAVAEGLKIEKFFRNVHISSRCLKHLFDKKPAEEFLFIVKHLREIAKYPDKIYLNREGKRGEICFVKKIGDFGYICSLHKLGQEMQIATAFRLRDKNYIKKYTLLWDWGNGEPHRSALDAPKESTSTPQ